MEKYYVVEISFGDSKISGKSIYEYETQREAVATFHQKIATAMKSDLYESELVMVIDNNGAVIKREQYAKPVVIESAPAVEAEGMTEG